MSDARVLSIDEILATDDIEFAEVPGYKPGEVIRIASLTAGDIIEWSEAGEGEAKKTAGLRLIVKSLVDENGKRIGKDEHIHAFKRKSHRQTELIVKAILKLNGMHVKSGEADEAKKD